jgi:ankyrin repeat protein
MMSLETGAIRRPEAFHEAALQSIKRRGNALNDAGCTPLDFASRDGHRNDSRVVRLLIEHGADPNTRASRSGFAPLHRASENRRFEVVRLLIEHGANVEVQDKYGRTPLNIASGDQREKILELLLEHRFK